MSRRDAFLLRLTAAWTLVIWAVFVRNQIGNDETSAGFKGVHLTLAAVSIALALVVWRIASRNSRRAATSSHHEERAPTAS